MHHCHFTTLAVLLGTTLPAQTDPHPIRIDRSARIEIATRRPQALAARLVADGYDATSLRTRPNGIEIIVAPGEYAALQRAGLQPAVLELGRPFRDRQYQAGSEDAPPVGYQSNADILAELQLAVATYPGLCRLVDAAATWGPGATWEGRPIWVLKISDNVQLDEDEPNVLVVSAHHCRELVTPVIALEAIRRLTSEYATNPTIQAVVDANEIWIAPVWNTDGYHEVFTNDNLWRKNRRPVGGSIGVDLNRNYPMGWSGTCPGSASPSSSTFKGPAPASEAETQTMLGFARARRFAKVLDFHSSGRETLYGYRCSDFALQTWYASEAIDLSNAAGYGGQTRVPSAEGEHYQWQLNETGAYAFLTETHTQFQPSYASAQAEAAQVFAEILHLLQRPIPLEGHVRDASSGAALEAIIDVEGIEYTQGEQRRSGGAFGRYHYWAGPGTRQVTFRAAGYTAKTVAVPFSSGGQLLDVTLDRETGEQRQIRAETELSSGRQAVRGTTVNSAPRRRGLATPHTVSAPRDGSEVWTSKLVYQAWAMDTAGNTGDYDVWFTRSIDGGISFAIPQRLDDQSGSALEVSVNADRHNVFVSWLSAETTGDAHLYCSVSSDQGQTFQGPFLINDPAVLAAGNTAQHWAAAAGNHCYFVFEYDDRGRAAGIGDEDVHFASLQVDPLSGAVTPSADRRVNRPGAGQIEDVDSPVVIADPDSGDVAVVWFDDRSGSNALYGLWSRSHGQDFPLAQDQRLNGSSAAAVSARNNVAGALANGRLHLVWEDRRLQSAGGLDVPFYNRIDLTTGARLFAADRDLTDWVVAGSHDADQPFLALDRDNPDQCIIAWHDDRDPGAGVPDSTNDVFAVISRDAGATWGSNLRLSTTSGPGTGQRNECWGVAWNGDHVVVSAARSAGNGTTLTKEDLCMFHSRDAGASFSETFITANGSSFLAAGHDIDAPHFVLTQRRNDVVFSYFSDAHLAKGLVTTGTRVPYVSLSNPLIPGADFNFQVQGIGRSSDGDTAVLLFNYRTSAVIPGFATVTGSGVDLDLVFDSLTSILLDIPSITFLPIAADGSATSATVTVPLDYPGDLFRVQAQTVDLNLIGRETTDIFE